MKGEINVYHKNLGIEEEKFKRNSEEYKKHQTYKILSLFIIPLF
jgi:hypothetical protein